MPPVDLQPGIGSLRAVSRSAVAAREDGAVERVLGQDVAGAEADLRAAIALGPEHISWYHLTLEPNTVFHARPPAGLPDEDTGSYIQSRGQRLLAIAFKVAAPGQESLKFADVESGLTLLGIVGIIDPPREAAIAAVRTSQAAGIRVKMITGDHAITASAIGRQMGIGDGATVVQGVQLDELDAAQLREQALAADVFARTSPEHKLRLVEALQANGQVVAMTGDGVNDAPALRKADIGVAMGIKGTRLPWLILGGGVTGLALALLMQWWMNAVDYPFIISGKPLFGLPANIPIVFELTVLLSALATFWYCDSFFDVCIPDIPWGGQTVLFGGGDPL